VSVAAVRLSELSEAERGARFARLQDRMAGVWDAMRRNEPGESIVVVPSVVPDPSHTGATLQALEERCRAGAGSPAGLTATAAAA
jgi:hypothetical protein